MSFKKSPTQWPPFPYSFSWGAFTSHGLWTKAVEVSLVDPIGSPPTIHIPSAGGHSPDVVFGPCWLLNLSWLNDQRDRFYKMLTGVNLKCFISIVPN
jgi:hypothetical protein